jgi:release factor glutamine methyltransferase
MRSFSRRIGKSLSNMQQDLISQELPKFILDDKNPLEKSKGFESISIEVGIGMAEHFTNQALLDPSSFFIGIEPYLNGIANCLKLMKQAELENFAVWPNDADMVLVNFDDETIEKFYLLFPDPWPKTKQKKRRFASKDRLNLIYKLIKQNGCFIFASDIADYAFEVEEICKKIGFKKISDLPHLGYIKTKFHSKAVEAGRDPIFMTFRK